MPYDIVKAAGTFLLFFSTSGSSKLYKLREVIYHPYC